MDPTIRNHIQVRTSMLEEELSGLSTWDEGLGACRYAAAVHTQLIADAVLAGKQEDIAIALSITSLFQQAAIAAAEEQTWEEFRATLLHHMGEVARERGVKYH